MLAYAFPSMWFLGMGVAPRQIFPAERYVIKAYGKNIIHKTDIGALKAGIERQDVALEARRMRNRLLKHKPEGFLVQEQVPKGIEVIIGAKRDEQFGDTVMFGMGGVNVELYRDISVRLCPVSNDDALEMMDEVKASRALDGFRGGPLVSRAMVAGIIKRVCSIMHANPGIREIDLNPVILYQNSYYAVDVRVIR